MKITNKHNLPQWLFEAAQGASYPQKPGSIGVSTLIRPPLVRHLLLTRWDDVEEDASDMLTRLSGDGWHMFCEKACSKIAGARTEKFVSTIIDGVKIAGKFDALIDGVLIDHKTTSAWSIVYDKTEWHQQLNCYVELLERNGYAVQAAEIHAILRDWSLRNKQRYGHDYPSLAFVVYPIEIWTPEQRLSFLKSRVGDHINSPTRPCTDDEKWYKPATYAVMKAGRQSALRVLDSPEEAQTWIESNPSKCKGTIEIEKRPATYPQCESYCPARSVCEFAQTLRSKSDDQ